MKKQKIYKDKSLVDLVNNLSDTELKKYILEEQRQTGKNNPFMTHNLIFMCFRISRSGEGRLYPTTPDYKKGYDLLKKRALKLKARMELEELLTKNE